MRTDHQAFKGTGVALVTPFQENRVDFPALERLVDHVIAGGVEYLVALGTTGESVTLSSEEQEAVLRCIIQTTNGRCPIVAGQFGGNDTAVLVEKLKRFNSDGIAAIMSSSPAYNKPSQEGIFQHYMTLAQHSPLPLIIYNVPGRTASNILPETVFRLASASTAFLGIKEASGDIIQVMKLLKHRPPGFLVISGDDPTALPLVACGGDGCISVIGNAFPKLFSGMIRAGLNGSLQEAKALNDQLLEIHPWLYIDGNPAGIKTVLHQLDICTEDVRLPLAPMYPAHKAALLQQLGDIQKI